MSGDPTLSVRERGKIERRQRVRQAALEMFTEKGYDSTTTKEIAERAQVGAGTVFVYARDKRELLFQITVGHVARLEQFGAEDGVGQRLLCGRHRSVEQFEGGGALLEGVQPLLF